MTAIAISSIALLATMERPVMSLFRASMLLAIAILSLGGCAGGSGAEPVSPMSSGSACLEQNGIWRPLAYLNPGQELNDADRQRHICDLPTGDAGKTCTDNRQCKGYCAAPDGVAADQTATGKCSAYVQMPADTRTVHQGAVSDPKADQVYALKQERLAVLEENRQKWLARGIKNYAMTLKQSCFCMYGPYYGPNRILVMNGKLKSVTYRGETRDGFRFGDELEGDALDDTVEGLFYRAERTTTEAPRQAVLDVTYHSDFGFPLSINYDDPNIYDEEYTLEVTDFVKL